MRIVALIAIFIALLPKMASATTPGVISVTNLTLVPSSQIVLNWTIDTTMTAKPSGAPGPNGPYSYFHFDTWDFLNRSPSGTGFPVAINNTLTTYTDTAWATDVRYSYYITGTIHSWIWDANANSGMGDWVDDGGHAMTWPTAFVTVRKVLVSLTQTVDTRLDLRFSTVQLVNYEFAHNTYRGGLFSGYNSDNAKVARTLMQFASITGPISSGEVLWPVGGMFVYSPRLSKAGTVSLICHKASSNSWTDTGLTWATAPAPLKSGTGNFSLTWSAGGAGQWIGINELAEIEYLAGTGNPLSFVFYSPSEDSNNPPFTAGSGWAYFARSQYQENGVGGFDTYLLYAFGGPGVEITTVTTTPTSVTGSNSATGFVGLASPAPAAGAIVVLSSADPSVTVPATMTVAAGQYSGTFSITTSTVSTVKNVTISATYGSTVNGSITVTPFISSVTFNPNPVQGGHTSTGTVTLYSAAPTGGLTVTLSSNDPSATVPSSMTIAAGQTSGTFTVTTSAVTSTKNVTITATKGSAVPGILTLNP